MGADLYNERFNKQSAEYQASDKAFKEFQAASKGTMTDEARKEYRELMDKVYEHPYYFRESYGGGGLLSALDLSWWRDVVPLCDVQPEDGLTDEEIDAWYDKNDINMSSDGCQKFIELLESRKSMLDAADYDYTDSCEDWHTKEPITWHVGDELRKKYNRLVEFLEIGKQHGGIYASL